LQNRYCLAEQAARNSASGRASDSGGARNMPRKKTAPLAGKRHQLLVRTVSTSGPEASARSNG